MKILLLGCRGMLGADLFTKLSATHEVLGKDRRELDITAERACREAIAAAAPDVVINAAAYTDVDACESARQECFAVNARGVKNIALACRGTATKILHFSTDYVFDGQKGSPYQEDDACRPLSVYGASKREGERLLIEMHDNFLILRSSWLYGKGGRNFVHAIFERARSVGKLEVVTDQVGSPTSTEDLAEASRALIEGGHRGIVHVANSGRCSWYEFAREILSCGGISNVPVLPILSVQLARPAPRPSYSVLDCRKFSALTGTVMRPWREALRAFLASREFMGISPKNRGEFLMEPAPMKPSSLKERD